MIAALLVIVSLGVGPGATADSAPSVTLDRTVDDPGEEFTVTVSTTHSAGTVVAFDTHADLQIESESAVKITDDRVEFLDANATDSTYTITVTVENATDDRIGVTAWVDADTPDAATARASTTLAIDRPAPAGAIAAVSAPDSITPGERFDVTVETTASAGTVVAFDADADLTLASESAVRIDGGRVEFVDPSAGPSTYTITVTVENATDDRLAIEAWVNAQASADAETRATRAVPIEDHAVTGAIVDIERPTTVAPGSTFDLTVTTRDAAGTVVAFDADTPLQIESPDAVRIDGNRVEFLDPTAGNATYTIEVRVPATASDAIGLDAWVNAHERDAADDRVSASVPIDEARGSVRAIDSPGSVRPGSTFTVTVTTRDAAGTVVAFDADTPLQIDSADAVRIDGNRVEFLDPTAGNATYTVEVGVPNQTTGAIGVDTWVNADVRAQAHDTASASVRVASETTSPAVTLTAPESIDPGETTTVTVETDDSAGTIVEFGTDADLTLESSDAVRIDGHRVEFIDPSAGSSTYTIEVGVPADARAPIAVDAWINAGRRAEADAVANASIGLTTEPQIGVAIDAVETPTVGARTNVTVSVTNRDSRPATDELSLSIDGQVVDERSVSLDGQEDRTITLAWAPANGSAGEHTLAVASGSDSVARSVTVASAQRDASDDSGDDDRTGGGFGGGRVPIETDTPVPDAGTVQTPVESTTPTPTDDAGGAVATDTPTATTERSVVPKTADTGGGGFPVSTGPAVLGLIALFVVCVGLLGLAYRYR